MTTIKVPGFSGYDPADLALAREIASQVIETYGDFDEHQMAQFRERGIWNDHISVQSALAAIRVVKATARAKPLPDSRYPQGIKLLATMCYEAGVLSVNRQGFGDADGNAEFSFAEEIIRWEPGTRAGTHIAVVEVKCSEVVFLRDHLNVIFPADDKGGK